MMGDYSIAHLMAAAFPARMAGMAASFIFAAIVTFMFIRKREPVGAMALFFAMAANPFILLVLTDFGNPFAPFFVAAGLLCFNGIFALGEHRDDRGVVAFAIGASAGVALSGGAALLYAPVALASPLLSPWRKSTSQIIGFLATLWAPSIMVMGAASYLAWLYPYASVAAPPLPAIGLAISPSNFFALSAAPSVLLGMAAPKIAGGARGAAFVATLTLASACLLAPADAFMTLGALAFAAEAAWTARLRRGGALSLIVVGAICAFLFWRHGGEPATIAAALSKLH